MLFINVGRVDKLLETSQELKIISYLQKLVNYDRDAKCLNISEEMQGITADYLIALNDQVVDSLFYFVNQEDFTHSIK